MLQRDKICVNVRNTNKDLIEREISELFFLGILLYVHCFFEIYLTKTLQTSLRTDGCSRLSSTTC